MAIGESIIEYRKARGITQRELADRLFVSVDLVSKWESGSRIPDHASLLSLAEVFCVPPEALIAADDLTLAELGRCIPDNVDPKNLPSLLNSFLDGLSERDCNVFTLRYYYFEEIKNVASLTGISKSNVKVILFRTRQKLKDFLRRNADE